MRLVCPPSAPATRPCHGASWFTVMTLALLVSACAPRQPLTVPQGQLKMDTVMTPPSPASLAALVDTPMPPKPPARAQPVEAPPAPQASPLHQAIVGDLIRQLRAQSAPARTSLVMRTPSSQQLFEQHLLQSLRQAGYAVHEQAPPKSWLARLFAGRSEDVALPEDAVPISAQVVPDAALKVSRLEARMGPLRLTRAYRVDEDGRVLAAGSWAAFQGDKGEQP